MLLALDETLSFEIGLSGKKKPCRVHDYIQRRRTEDENVLDILSYLLLHEPAPRVALGQSEMSYQWNVSIK